MLPSIRSLLVVVTIALSCHYSDAQCFATGLGCRNAITNIGCGTHPRIGTTFVITPGNKCPSKISILAFGGCNNRPLPWPATCMECRNCNLDVFPVLALLAWDGVTDLKLPIPNDPGLVGAETCVQNACSIPARSCACLSNAIWIRIIN